MSKFDPSAIDQYVSLAADDYDISPALLKGLLHQESRFNPDAYNERSGARGIAQFLPATAKEVGIDPDDPIEAIFGAAAYLNKQIKTFGGDVSKGLAAYNYGQGNIGKLIDTHGDDWINNLPDETTKYLTEISDKAETYLPSFSKAKYGKDNLRAAENLAPVNNDIGDPGMVTGGQFDSEFGSMRDAAAEEPAAPTAKIRGSVMDGYPVAPPKPENRAPYDSEYLKQVESERAIAEAPGKQGVIKASTFDFDTAKKFDQAATNPLVRGAYKGYLNTVEAPGGLIEFAADAIGADTTHIRDVNSGLKSREDAIGENKDRFLNNLEGAVSSIVSQAPAWLAGATPALMYIGLQSFGQEYSAGRAAGLDMGDASARASAYGAAEVIGERIGSKTLAAGLKKVISGAPTGDIAGAMARHIAHEIPGEELTTALQFGTDKFASFGLNPDATLKDYIKQVQDTLVQTVMHTGAMTGGGMAMSSLRASAAGETNAIAAADIAKQQALAKADFNFGQTDARISGPETVVGIADSIMGAKTPEEAAAKMQEHVAQVPITPTATYDASTDLSVPIKEIRLDEQQQQINDAFASSVGTDGVAVHNGIPVRAVSEDSMPAFGTVQSTGQVTREGAQALRSTFDPVGIKVVFYDDDNSLPDGFESRSTPNTVFVSNNPTRAADYVARHEVKHILENTALPDGRVAGEVLLEMGGRGITQAGLSTAEKTFGANAPTDPAAARAFYVNELLADAFSSASKTQAFMDKTYDYLRKNYSQSVAIDVITKIIDSIGSAMKKVEALFGGRPTAEAAKWFSNLEEIHGVMVEALGTRIGETAKARQAEAAKLRAVKPATSATWTPDQEQALNKLGHESRRAGKENAENAEELANQYDDMLMLKNASMGHATELDAAAHQAATSPLNDLPQPSRDQILGDNAKLGHYELHPGIPASVENPAGSLRKDLKHIPPKWSVTMKHDYGRLKNTKGSDGEAIDFFRGPNPKSDKVFVIDQKNPDGSYDEHKVMFHFNNIDQAKLGYRANYSKGWDGIKSITPTTVEGFKEWLRNGDTTRPFVEHNAQGELQFSPKRKQGDLFAGDFANKKTTIDKTYVIGSKGTKVTYQKGNVDAEGNQIAGSVQSLENFWNWFDGSVVVRLQNALPMPMYHGTRADITKFESMRETNNTGMFGAPYSAKRAGIFFTENPEFAEDYAGDRTGANVMRVYLNIQEPADFSKGVSEKLERDLADNGYNTRRLQNAQYDWELFDEEFGGPELVAALKKAGYDGAIITEQDAHDETQRVFIAFDANQIKSATGNLGTFSAKNDDIRYSPKTDAGHKQEKVSGRFVGAPDWVGSNPKAIERLRGNLRVLAKEGEIGRYWYEKSAQAVMRLVNNNKADAEKFIGLLAIFSSSTGVSTNTTFAMQAWNQWKSGQTIKSGRYPALMSRKAEAWLNRGEDFGGIKTNNFYQDLMEEIDPSKVNRTHSTMDMWMALAFDYGSKILDQGPKYGFAQREINHLAKELGWKPHQVQAAIWTSIKGRIEGSEGARKAWERQKGILVETDDGKEHIVKAREYEHFRAATRFGLKAPLTQADIDASNYDFGTAIGQRTVNLSREAMPGATSGVLPGIHSATMAQKIEYQKAIDAALTDDKGHDRIYEMVGLLADSGAILYSGWQGKTTTGVQQQVGVVLDGPKVSDTSRIAVNLAADIRGLVNAQEGVAWHFPLYDGAKYGQNGIEFVLGRDLTEAETDSLYHAISRELGHTYAPPIPVPGKGFRVLNFPDEKFALGQATEKGNIKYLQKTLRAKNDAFRAAVKRAVSLQAFAAQISGNETFETFETDGELRENKWTNGGRGYRSRIAQAIEQLGTRGWTRLADIQARIDYELIPRVEAVNRDFSQRYGWGNPNIQFSPKQRPDAAGGTEFGSVRSGTDQASKPGSVSGTGVHYSIAERNTLVSSYFGTGYKGAELTRVRESSDPRIQHRIYFYVNNGNGINRESGVGPYAHKAELTNVYDMAADTLDLRKGRDPNQFESSVIDAGFDGYTAGNAAVLLGQRTVKVTPLGMGVTPTVDRIGQAERSPLGKLQDMIAQNKTLPAGEMAGAEWKRALPELGLSHLDDSKKYYKDQLLQMSPKQTETPEFKRWFGYSVVVDANGKPMVLYHGTPHDVDHFNVSPIFLTPDRDAASAYSVGKYADADNPAGPNVMPVYVKILNPKILTEKQLKRLLGHEDGLIEWSNFDNLAYELQKKGFDGVHILDTLDYAGLNNEGESFHRRYDQWVAFANTQIKSAIGNNGQFDASNPDIRFSPKPIFYSHMAKQLDTLMGKQEPAKELTIKLDGWVRGGKFKSDELEWSGLKDWLATQTGKVSREDVKAFVENNGVKVQEVVLGTTGLDDGGGLVVGRYGQNEFAIYRADEGDSADPVGGTYSSKAEAERALVSMEQDLPTKFANWQLPGGENYRELLLTLPDRPSTISDSNYFVDTVKYDDGETRYFAVTPNSRSHGYKTHAEAKKALADRPRFEQTADVKNQQFHSSHFDQPNILAHVRFNERIDAEGKRVLFIEEVQSDWAQKGRKDGFASSVSAERMQELQDVRNKAASDLENTLSLRNRRKGDIDYWKNKFKELDRDPRNSVEDVQSAEQKWMDAIDVYEKINAEVNGLYAADSVAENALSQAMGRGIPSAPFVKDTGSWTALAFKRMLRYAAENGFDKIAWTTGEQQAARYDLSKQVDSVQISKIGDDKFNLGVTKDGRAILNELDVSSARIEEVVGKDLAKKAQVMPEGKETFTGLDLKIGGEGMKGFYDNILPNEISKYVKKWGAKVGETLVYRGDGSGDIIYRTEPADRLENHVYVIGNDSETIDKYASIGGGWTTDINDAEEFTPVQAKAHIASYEDLKSLHQPSITITPEMRASVLEGQPQFSPKQFPDLNAPEETFLQGRQRVIQDKFIRFKVIYDWAKANGIPLSEAANVYLHEALSYGRRAVRVEDFRDLEFKPIVKETQRAGLSQSQVQDYLHAMHAEERNRQIAKINKRMPDGGSGMDTATARDIISRATPELKAVAAKIRAITDSTLQMKLDAQLIPQDQFDAYKATYKNYVPLKGGDEIVATGTGKGFDINHKMRRALGHTFREENIIENILRDHETAIALVEKQHVAASLFQLSVELDDPSLITVGLPEKRAVLKPGQVQYEVRYDGGTVAVLHNLDDARAEMVQMMQDTGMPAKKWAIAKVQGDSQVAYEASPMLKENEARFYINGEAIRIQIKDPMMARAYKNMGVDRLVGILRIGKEVNSWLSKAYTGYNPEFLAVNMARDFTEGVINLTGDYGALTAAKVTAAYPRAFAQLVKYAAGGKASQQINDYRADGGSTGAAYLSDLERITKDLHGAYNDYAGIMDTASREGSWAAAKVAGDKTFRLFAHVVEIANQAGENAMRLATYNTLCEAGYSRKQAALAAKDVTLNFNRKGEIGSQMGALWLFFTPAVQGTARTLQTMLASEHKGQARVLVGGIMALGYAMAALNAGSDPDKWDKIPGYVKGHNIITPGPGGTQVTVPVPYGYGFFLSLGVAAFELSRGKKPKDVAWMIANAFAESYSPVGNPISDKPDMKNVVQLLPTMARIPMEITVNKSGLGGPIYPDSSYHPGRPDSSVMFRGTKGSIWDKAATAANAATGGDKARAGWVDVHPDVLRSLFSSATGGTGRSITDSANAAYLKSQGAELDAREMPVVRRFLREETITDSRRQFYEAKDDIARAVDELNTVKSLIKQAGQSKNVDMAKEYALVGKQIIAEERALLSLANAVKGYQKAITAKRDKEDAIMADSSLPIADRRKQVKAIEQEERVMYSQFMSILNAQKKK